MDGIFSFFMLSLISYSSILLSPLDYFLMLDLVAGLGLLFLLKYFLTNLCESLCCAEQRPGC